MVCAQKFCHAVGDIGIEAADRGAHDDHRRNADDDTDQGQKGAQFVGQDRLQGDPGGVGID